MPKVPTIQPGAVQTKAFPTARVRKSLSLDTFNTGLDSQQVGIVKNVINQASHAVQKERAKASKTKSNLTYIEANDEANKHINVYKSKKLKQADEDKDKDQKAFYDKLDSFDSRFVTDEEKESWSIQKARTKLRFDNTTENHALREREAFMDSKMKDGMTLVKEDMASNYIEPNKIDSNLHSLRKLSEDYAEMKGYSKESTEKLVKENESSAHSVVISKMVNDENDKMAKEYFNNYKDGMVSTDKMRAQRIVEEGSFRGNSQRFVDGVMDKGMSESEAISYTRKNLDGKAEDDAVSRIKTRYSEAKSISKEAENTLFNKSYNVLSNDPRHDAVPASDWIKLNPGHQKVLNNLLKSKTTGNPIKTDLASYRNLQQMKAYDFEKFLKVNMLDYADKLNESDWTAFQDAQDEMKRSGAGAKLKSDGFRTDREVVKDTLGQYGYDTSNQADRDEKKRISAMEHEVDSRVELWKRNNGKNYIDPDSLKDIVDSVAQPVTTIEKGILWDSEVKRPAYSVPLVERKDSYVDFEDIPESHIREIKNKFTSKGRPAPSNEVIQSTYMKWLNKQR